MTLNGRTILASLLLAASTGAMAQLNGSVSVEGEYEPLFIETERLNAFPRNYRFELPPANISYETMGVVTDFRPSLLTMGVTGRRADLTGKKPRGYIDFRLGSYLNSRLDAGCYILSDSLNTLLADVKFQSSTLWRTHDVPASFTAAPLKRLYDGEIGLSYTRLTGSEGRLQAGLSYRGAYSNYYGTALPKALLPAGTDCIDIPTQTLNEANVSFKYLSSASRLRGWHAEAEFNLMAYRRLYTPKAAPLATANPFNCLPGERESQLKAGAGYAFALTSSTALTVDVEGDFLFYPKRGEGREEIISPGRRNYGLITLTPAYNFENDLLSMRAGLDLTASYDAMGADEGKRFAAVHLAPDVSLAYNSRSGFGVELSATGGVTPATLRMREEFDRYLLPAVLSTAPVYTPVDARLRFAAGPFAGFSASATLRYAIAKNVPLGGWYQYFLGTYPPAADAFDSDLYLSPRGQNADLKGFGAELSLGYAYGELVRVSFTGAYTPQNGKTGIFNGFDRPRWVMEAKAEVSPIKQLKIEVGYEYRGVRNCWFMASADPAALAAFRLPDVTDLKAKVSYSILDNLSLYCQGGNLLNRRILLLPGLQSEGLIISGGLSVIF